MNIEQIKLEKLIVALKVELEKARISGNEKEESLLQRKIESVRIALDYENMLNEVDQEIDSYLSVDCVS